MTALHYAMIGLAKGIAARQATEGSGHRNAVQHAAAAHGCTGAAAGSGAGGGRVLEFIVKN